jgi:hypothetical protein
MRESRTSGSVRGDRGNPVPYRYNSSATAAGSLASQEYRRTP